MVSLKYIASSGNVYDLQANGEILTRAANYHVWAYTPVGNALQYGQRVTGFTRDPAEYTTELVFNGVSSVRKQTIGNLHKDFELDLRTGKTGRLYWADYYIDCYITASSTAPTDNANYTTNEINIFAPYPFWIREATRTFMPQSAPGEQEFLDYEFDYEYDYFYGTPGIAIWETDIAFETDFKLTIFGAASDPRILVNGHPYEINDTLESNEYLVIDSRNNTVTKYLANGQTSNIFDLRNKAESVFARMPAGTLTFNWSGAFGFDLTLYEERNEPEG